MVIALPLGAAAEAAAGLLLLAAAFAIALLVADLLGALPVIGPAVGPAARNATLGAIARLVTWSVASAQGLASVIAAPFVSVWSVIDSMTWTDWKLAQKIWGLRAVTIPAVERFAFDEAQAAKAYAVAYAEYVKLALWQAINAWVTILVQRMDGLHAQALAYTDYVKLALWQAINAWVTILVQRMDTGLAQERAWADARVGQAIDYAGQIGARDLRVIDQVAEQLARRMDMEVGRALEFERATADTLVRDIAGAEARAGAYAGALVVPVAASLAEVRDSPCFRYCSPLGDLGQLLQGLEDAGLLAVLLALVHDATHDPAQVERMLSDVFREPVKDVVSALGLGIPA